MSPHRLRPTWRAVDNEEEAVRSPGGQGEPEVYPIDAQASPGLRPVWLRAGISDDVSLVQTDRQMMGMVGDEV